MDRRTFLQLTAGAGAGLWAAAAFGAVGDRSDSLEIEHFQSDHVVLVSQMTAPSPAVIEAIRRRVEGDKRSWPWATTTSLELPNGRLTLLIKIMRHITGHYRRSDVFADWTLRPVRREELAGTGSHGVGLGHEFQGQDEFSTRERDIDWWAFLIPEGIEFDAIDGEPIHLIVIPVFGKRGMTRTIESWAAAIRLAKYVNPQRLARKNPADATDQLNRALLRSLHEIRNPDSSNRNGRHR